MAPHNAPDALCRRTLLIAVIDLAESADDAAYTVLK